MSRKNFGNLYVIICLAVLSLFPGHTYCQARSQSTSTLVRNNAALEDLALSRSQSAAVNPAARQITVTATSDQEVTPDIIYISITLREYFTDNSQKQKMLIEDLERTFLRKVYDAGVLPAAISIESFSGSISTGNRKKNDQFLASKRYLIKMSDLDKMNGLVASLDPRALSRVYVNRFEYSRQEETKRALRIKALQDARQKASYMLASIDETLGEPLSIEEIGSDDFARSTPASFSAMAQPNQTPEINFQKIRLNAVIKVVFRIK